MDKTKLDNFVNSLNERKGNKQCPICQNNDWNIGDKLTELREYQGGDLHLGGQIYPLIVFTCKVCGYTLLYNAIIAGVIDPKNNDKTSPVESAQLKSENVMENEP